MEKYTYEIRPNKPFNFMDKTIKTNCSLQLSIPEALTIIESNKARVYRIFPDINNSVKVDKNNIHELHRKYFNSKPIINRANSITEKALDKSEDKVISSNDAFNETRENEKKEIVNKSEEEIKDTANTTQQDAEEVPEENKEEIEELADDSAAYNFNTEEVIEQVEEDKVVESEVISEESESSIVEEKEEETIEEVHEEVEDTKDEDVESISDDEKEESNKEVKKDNRNRFYNTQIITNGNGGKKKHKK